MFNVHVLVYCGYSVFGSYCTLVSKNGKLQVGQVNKTYPLTHYMICQSNRLIYKNSFTSGSNPKYVTLQFLEQVSEIEFVEHELTLPTEHNGKSLAVYVDNHATGFVVWSDDEKPANTYPTFFEALVAIAGQVQCNEDSLLTKLLSLEVLYVGQTEIKKNYLRIDGHEKYAQAADDVIRSRPHKQLFLKLHNFDNPTWIVAEDEKIAEKKLKTIKALAKKHDHPAWITLFEAALIHHLQPYLNVHFKNTFPSSKHVGYKHLLDIGINNAEIVIDEKLRSYCTKQADNTYTRELRFTFSLSS
jgi:hypothetical protein